MASSAYLYIWFLNSNFNIICITIIVLYLLCNLRYYSFFFNTIYNTFSILYCQIKVCFDKKKNLFLLGRVIPIIPIKLHRFTLTSFINIHAEHKLFINVKDLLPICRGIKMYENKKKRVGGWGGVIVPINLHLFTQTPIIDIHVEHKLFINYK